MYLEADRCCRNIGNHKNFVGYGDMEVEELLLGKHSPAEIHKRTKTKGIFCRYLYVTSQLKSSR